MSNTTQQTRRPSETDVRRVVASSFLGTSLEWYDFFLFGTTAAIVFAPLFFPSTNQTAATLSAFVSFGIGFLARPLGAIFFGHFGDRLGRKGTLVATLLLMGIATTLMGLLPDFSTAGVTAPLMLTLLRIAQGLAAGGEWGGATLMALEFAPEEKKGLYASIVQMGSPVGNILSTGAVTLMITFAGPNFLTWGWRIPYLLSVVLIGVALWMRVGLKESPEFEKVLEQHEVQKVPFAELVAKAWARVLVATMMYLFGVAGFFMMTTFGISYVRNVVKANPQLALNGILAGAVIEIIALWAIGTIAKRVGAPNAFLLGSVVSAVVVVAFFPMLHTGDPVIITLAYMLGLGVAGLPYGPVGAVMNRLFPTRYNYSALAVSANLAGVIAGFMPFFATAVMGDVGSPVLPSIVTVALALISLAGAILAKVMLKSDEDGRSIGISGW